MASYLWIGLGGALGSMARYWCAGYVAERIGTDFPWGTFTVNVVGSFLIGVLATAGDGRFPLGGEARQFLMIGLLGGYTTFSAFSLETLSLARDGDWLRAGGNIVLSVALCLVAVWFGHLAATALNQIKG